MTSIPEVNAAAIFAIAIRNKRAAELLEHLFSGGGVMLDPRRQPPKIILIPLSEIERVSRESFEERT